VKHVNFVWNKFHPVRRLQNMSAHQYMMKIPYHYSLCRFGATVMAHNPAATETGKAELRSAKAIWLGRTNTSAEHIVSMRCGIRRVRSVRVLPDRDGDEFNRLACWSLWNQQPDPGYHRPETLPADPEFGTARRITSWLDVRHLWMTSLRRWDAQTNVRDATLHGRGHAGVDTTSDAKIDRKSSESSMLRPHPRLRQLKHR